ncbi:MULTISPECIES: hypothetical protein [unclassified Streptomyces]|uniref:hypothetical protein n=1 Tax=unclassified Streptomyces TaxID=2593676 RepID=UPI0019073671|nr:hypothetical protein [Streptomyces sp. HSG2]
MRGFLRGVVIAAALVPFGAASVGIACADSYDWHSASAGPDGAASSHVMSGTTADGGAYFVQRDSMAGPDGAMSTGVQSVATGGTGTSPSTGLGGGFLGLGGLLG